jgi:hypothetical protein
MGGAGKARPQRNFGMLGKFKLVSQAKDFGLCPHCKEETLKGFKCGNEFPSCILERGLAAEWGLWIWRGEGGARQEKKFHFVCSFVSHHCLALCI